MQLYRKKRNVADTKISASVMDTVQLSANNGADTTISVLKLVQSFTTDIPQIQKYLHRFLEAVQIIYI